MRIDPQLAALRSDRALQRCVQQKMDEATARLSRSDKWSQVMGALGSYGEGADLAALPALARLFSQADYAQDWIGHWVRSMVAFLADNPLGQISNRHSHSSGLTTLQLATRGRAAITLLVFEGTDQQGEAKSALFVDREQVDLVISGQAIANVYSLDGASPASIQSQERAVGPGSVIDISGPSLARRFIKVKGSLVLLQLARVISDPQPSREFQLSDGALLRQSSGDKRASQEEMAMALLGAMGRTDASPVMAAKTAAGADHVRWEALRQCLHLDAAHGFAVLSRLAGDKSDTLASSARALKHSLQQAHPELARLENA